MWEWKRSPDVNGLRNTCTQILSEGNSADSDQLSRFAICSLRICWMRDIIRLTLKAPITTAADAIHNYFFIVFLEKIGLYVSSVSSPFSKD